MMDRASNIKQQILCYLWRFHSVFDKHINQLVEIVVVFTKLKHTFSFDRVHSYV